jgi:hypothetical protein
MIELTHRLGLQWTIHWTMMEDDDDGLEQDAIRILVVI